MRTRSNQLLIQILLLIVIAAIIAYTYVNIAELAGALSNAVGEAIIQFKGGF